MEYSKGIIGENLACNKALQEIIHLKFTTNMNGITKTNNDQPLNQTELQILKLICKQRTTKQIGDEMCMSVKNVERYREHLLNKTNADNMAGLVMYAMKNKLFPDL